MRERGMAESTFTTYKNPRMPAFGNSSPAEFFYLSNSEMDALTIISLITAALSFFGASSVLFCSVINRRVCCPEIFPTFHLSLADLLSSVFLVVSSSMFMMSEPTFPGSPGPCGYIMAVVTTYVRFMKSIWLDAGAPERPYLIAMYFHTSCYTSSFLLTISYALEALFRFRRRLIDGARQELLNTQVVSCRWMYLFYILCWLVPFALAVSVMDVVYSLKDRDDFNDTQLLIIIPRQCSSCFANFRFNEDYCWDQVERGRQWHLVIRLIFIVPLMLVMVVNMILYILIARTFRQVSMRRGLLSYHQRQEESVLRRKAMMYQGVFVICWFPSVILGIISFKEDFQMNDFYWLLLIQAILGPLQGLFNCILYGWRRESFRRVLSESTSLLSTNRSATMSVTL